MMDKINPQKKVDVPPTGRRNADPITNAPGSHPIETGIGAASRGRGQWHGRWRGHRACRRTAIGAAIGAVAGGYAGKGVGEIIDPTTEDNWLRDNFTSGPTSRKVILSSNINPLTVMGQKPSPNTELIDSRRSKKSSRAIGLTARIKR